MHLPDDGTDHDGLLTSEDIREVARNQGSQPGAAGHGSSNATLDVALRTLAWFIALVEIALVGIGANDGAHGTDIETEQSTPDNGHRCNDIDLGIVSIIYDRT